MGRIAQRWARGSVFLLVIFALIGAMVSPACAFVSGKQSWLEICSSADAMAEGSASDRSPIPLEAQKNCAFCFAQSHLKPLAFARVQIASLRGSVYDVPSFMWVLGHPALQVALYDTRAPPLSFVLKN